MKWIHILDEQPKDNSVIVQLDMPYINNYEVKNPGDFSDHWPLGMRLYKEIMPWEEYIKWCTEREFMPNFWWMYAKDFSFPDFP